jgi:hypothetical protein
MNKIRALILTAIATFGFQSAALAEGSATGSDMWTRIFEQWGLFHPHEDYCDSSTEAFITISGSASQGFCIEKNERNAATWDVARDDCASDKKRLPEPGEFKFACNNGVGLSNMTDDFEWASNFTVTIHDHTGGAGLTAAKMGSGGCHKGSYDFVAWNNGASAGSLPYRCVR